MDEGAPSVLLGWELGGGLGHVRQLLLLADALAGRGLRPILALRDLIGPSSLLRACPYPILQAPAYSKAAQFERPGFVARSYADILAVRGFADADHLLAMSQAWLALFEVARPTVVVGDHSPTLCLAASGLLPTVLFGNGYLMPPADLPSFPVLTPERPAVVDEAHLLAAVQKVQRRLGRSVAATLPGLFATAGRFVTVLPELDPYQDVRREAVIGPMEPLGPPLPAPDHPGFFAYLDANMPGCEAILTFLAQTGFPGRVYVRDANSEGRNRLRSLGLEVFDQPAPMNEMLAQAAVIVSQGNGAVVQAALAAGRPQLLFPSDLEKLLYARRLHALGVAHFLTGQFPAADVGAGLRQLLTDPSFSRQAQAAAVAVRTRGPYNPVAAIVACCEQMILRPASGRLTPPARLSDPIHSPLPLPTSKESMS